MTYPDTLPGSSLMFEHFTETARLTLLFARYETAELGDARAK